MKSQQHSTTPLGKQSAMAVNQPMFRPMNQSHTSSLIGSTSSILAKSNGSPLKNDEAVAAALAYHQHSNHSTRTPKPEANKSRTGYFGGDDSTFDAIEPEPSSCEIVIVRDNFANNDLVSPDDGGEASVRDSNNHFKSPHPVQHLVNSSQMSRNHVSVSLSSLDGFDYESFS